MHANTRKHPRTHTHTRTAAVTSSCRRQSKSMTEQSCWSPMCVASSTTKGSLAGRKPMLDAWEKMDRLALFRGQKVLLIMARAWIGEGQWVIHWATINVVKWQPKRVFFHICRSFRLACWAFTFMLWIEMEQRFVGASGIFQVVVFCLLPKGCGCFGWMMLDASCVGRKQPQMGLFFCTALVGPKPHKIGILHPDTAGSNRLVALRGQ